MKKFDFFGKDGVFACEVKNPVTKNRTVFHTNKYGDGLFLSVYDCESDELLVVRKQIQGTVAFSVNGVKENSKKVKLRRFIRNYFKEIWDCEL